MNANVSEETVGPAMFLGGSLWIDFVNTRFDLNGDSVDFLRDDASLAGWAKMAGVAHDEPMPKDERVALIKLRDVLSLAFEQVAGDVRLSTDLLDEVNGLLSKQTVQMRLAYKADSIVMEEQVCAEGPRMAITIATDFAEFVIDFEAARLKHCDNPSCAMVFYDQGKNKRRRWCSTAICGNRDKVANYRARKSGPGNV